MEAVSTKWIALCLLQLASCIHSGDVQFHPCDRECVAGAPPVRCTYDFNVQWYQSMSKACYNCPFNITDCFRPECIPLDGIERSIVTVNKILPGPLIQACVGDMVEIVVHNHLPEETTSIHWHGLHQRESPYMDGVPFVTQCPILPRASFKYLFEASTPGTHFWHSHSGSQRGDGMFGGLIIRRPKSEDRHGKLYDHDLQEHIMTVLDWHHKMGTATFLEHHHSDGDNKPNNILVNGMGRFRSQNAHNDHNPDTPVAVFNVHKGQRYRFRLINAGFLNCPIEMSIDNHTITVINSDGGDIEPVQATSLVSYAGERWDFILHPVEDVKNYWIRFRGLMDCDDRFTSAFQVAILHYEGAPDPYVEEPEGTVVYGNSHNAGLQINPLNQGSGNKGALNIPELISMEPLQANDDSLKETADITHYLAYDFYPIDNPHYHKKSLYGFNSVIKKKRVLTPQINHVSMKLPSFPLLSQRDEIKPGTFCEPHRIANCTNEFCECTHLIHVPFSSVVELILVDEGFAYDANHPFHLHGYPFRVVAMERLGKNVTVPQIKALDRAGQIKRNLKSAPLKDTVTVPDGGYTIIRFHATNPGYWLFHCHIEFHVELGMAVIFKIGEDENMPPVPHRFPKCGDYLPSIEEEISMYRSYNSSRKQSQVPGSSTTLTPLTGKTTDKVSDSLWTTEDPSELPTQAPVSVPQTTTRNLARIPSKPARKEEKSRTEEGRIQLNDIASILQLLQGNIIKTEYRYSQHEPDQSEATTLYNLFDADASDTNQLKPAPNEDRDGPLKTSLDRFHFAFIPVRIRNRTVLSKVPVLTNFSETDNEISPTLSAIGKNYLKYNQVQSATSASRSNSVLILVSLFIATKFLPLRIQF